MSRPVYRFADFLLDPASRELRREGRRTPLPPKSLECLIYLVEHRDRAVGRDELISAVWGRVDVSDALLAQTLLRARRAVGDSGNDQISIRTVPRFGYQWVASTEAVAAEPAPATPGSAAPDTGSAHRSADRRRLGLFALLLVAAAALLVWKGQTRERSDTAPQELLVVAPVSLPGGGSETAWIRLGVMDYIATRLRAAGLTVLPSERVAGLVAERRDEALPALHRHLREASGATQLLQPIARLRDDGTWQLRLHLQTAAAEHEFSGGGATPLAAADEATQGLLRRLGRAAAAPRTAPAAERLQRLDAAMLEGDLATARNLIATAEPGLRADPALQVREGQLAFRAGDLAAAEAIFAALQEHLDSLPRTVQAQALMGRGALAVRRGAFADAERRYAEALAVLGADGAQDLLGNGYGGRGVARAAQQQYALAAADLARARVALERAGDAPGVASVDTNLGLLETRSGKPAAALQSFDRAIAVFERYGVRDSLAAGLLGKARAQLVLGAAAASLATSRRAWALGQTLENPVLIRGLALQLAEALRSNGQLAEAARLLDGLPRSPASDEMAETRARLALERGDAALALHELAAVAAPGDDALLLRTRAVLALPPDAASQTALAAALAGDAGAASGVREHARALWQQAYGGPQQAHTHFAAALAHAERGSDAERRIAVLADWIEFSLRLRELDRATELAGLLSPHIAEDYRAARAAAAYYRAVGDTALLATAQQQMAALAGERARGLPDPSP